MIIISIPARLTHPDPIDRENAQTVYDLIVDKILGALRSKITAPNKPAQFKIAARMSPGDFETFRTFKKNPVAQLSRRLQSLIPAGVTLVLFEYVSSTGQFEATFTIQQTTP